MSRTFQPVACFSYLAAAELWQVAQFPLANYGAEVLNVERSIAADAPMAAAVLAALDVPTLLLAIGRVVAGSAVPAGQLRSGSSERRAFHRGRRADGGCCAGRAGRADAAARERRRERPERQRRPCLVAALPRGHHGESEDGRDHTEDRGGCRR